MLPRLPSGFLGIHIHQGFLRDSQGFLTDSFRAYQGFLRDWDSLGIPKGDTVTVSLGILVDQKGAEGSLGFPITLTSKPWAFQQRIDEGTYRFKGMHKWPYTVYMK